MNADWEAVVVGVVIAFPIRLYRMGPKNRGADGVEIGGKLLVSLGMEIFLIVVTGVLGSIGIGGVRISRGGRGGGRGDRRENLLGGAGLHRPSRRAVEGGRFVERYRRDRLTQVQRKMPVVQIILNNESLDFVKIEMQEAGLVSFGVDFKNPNFAKVAEAMGAKGIRIEEPGDLSEAIAEALAHRGGPVVVDVVVDAYALSLPSHIPFHTASGFTLSLAKQVLKGEMDSVVKSIGRNVGLV